MATRTTRRSAAAPGTLAPITFTGVRDIGNQSMASALRGAMFAAKAIEAWPALGKDFAKGDTENWALFDAGAVDAYDLNNPAPYAVRGEDATYTLSTDKPEGADPQQLTLAYLRSMTPTDWRNTKDNAPTLYTLCKDQKDKGDAAIRSARRNLRNKVDAYLKADSAPRAANKSFVEAITAFVKNAQTKCTNQLAKKDGEVSDETIAGVRLALAEVLKAIA